MAERNAELRRVKKFIVKTRSKIAAENRRKHWGYNRRKKVLQYLYQRVGSRGDGARQQRLNKSLKDRPLTAAKLRKAGRQAHVDKEAARSIVRNYIKNKFVLKRPEDPVIRKPSLLDPIRE